MPPWRTTRCILASASHGIPSQATSRCRCLRFTNGCAPVTRRKTWAVNGRSWSWSARTGATTAQHAHVAGDFIDALDVDEAMYPTANVDAHGAPLDGSKRYELGFATGKALKVGAF